MAFHGDRSNSRGRSRGSLAARGGGFRGRGGSSAVSRGRGRGRGGFGRGRGKPIFDSARVAEKKTAEDDETEASSDVSEEEEQLPSGDSSSEEDDVEDLPSVKPYQALLQSLTVDKGHQSKKRKIDHASSAELLQHESSTQTDADTDDLDEVMEEEEGPETSVEVGLEDDEDIVNASDPFESHFANPDDNVLSKRLKSLQKLQWTTRKLIHSNLGRATVSFPGDDDIQNVVLPALIASPEPLMLKQRLASVIKSQRPTFDSLEQSIAPCIFNYQDLLYCGRTSANSERLRRLSCLHALSHIFKTRDRVIKNNARLAKEENNNELDLRDQGFTRPKVLMLLPTREACVRMVNMIISLCQPEQQENRKRFEDSYVEKEEKFSVDKTDDFRELFGGNDDDMFRLGMKFTRKTMKYFSQFYNSDIIFASPLALRMALGAEDQKVDHDFLSSIEIVVVDQADALLMQNWEHVEFIFEHLNLQPREAHGCDFSRVRPWYLDNNSRHFRQVISFAAFNTPELNNLFYNQSKNWAGRLKIDAIYDGALQELGQKVRQTFSRLESPSIAGEPDARFLYFTTAIIPSLVRHNKDSAGTLIFIPSYLDFVRIRNYLATSTATNRLSFGSISEYTSVREVARARSHFFTGRHNILLYTERAHHFRRYQLRGVRNVIMYGLPDNPLFYKEIAGGYTARSVQEGKLEPGTGSIRVLFSRWDAMKLERIAGTERVGRMIKEKGDTFDFL